MALASLGHLSPGILHPHSCTMPWAQEHTLTQRGQPMHTGPLGRARSRILVLTPAHAAAPLLPPLLGHTLTPKTWLKPGEV